MSAGSIQRQARSNSKKSPRHMRFLTASLLGQMALPIFCEFGNNKIGKIDPRTLNVTEIVLPNQGARPRRISNNSDGLIYYSDFARGFIGRFDPKTEKVEEWPSPGGPNSHPYGIASTR